MNIGILINGLNGGGAERCAAELSKYLTAKGHHVYIITENLTKGRYDFSGKIIIIRQSTGSRMKHLSTVKRLLYLTQEMKKIKKKYRIQTAISFMEDYNIPNILSKTTERVIIRVCTILSVRDDKKGFLYHPVFLRLLYNRADQVIAISKDGRNDLMYHYGIAPQKIMIIPNTVETSSYPDEVWNWQQRVLICVQRIVPLKQQMLLAKVFSKVMETCPDMMLLFVGNDRSAYAHEVKEVLKRHHVPSDRVAFTGQVRNVRFYLERSDMYISFAKVEAFGNTTIEALSAGLPVICMDAPGATREILAPGTKKTRSTHKTEYSDYGILFPLVDENNADDGQIVYLANELANIWQNDDIKQSYRQNARKRAAWYSMKNIGKLWDQAIEGVTKNG